jgi:two-component sensor histidine kinase
MSPLLNVEIKPAARLDECVVILAPFGQDARLISETLEAVGVPTRRERRVGSFCTQIGACAAGILTTEALSSQAVAMLQIAIEQQPLWSDVPLILLGSQIDSASYRFLADALGNVTIIGRPLDASSLHTVVATAVRARRKQYQVRDLLHAGEIQNAQILALNERLKRAMMETHHRVKNNLQLISAFVDIQILENEQFVPTGELMRINSHIRALAAVHDLLTHETKTDNRADSVSVKLLLDKLLPTIQEILPGKRLLNRIEDLRLTSRQATSLALIVNELILNAVKQGASQVEVTLKIRALNAVLTVCDDGPGLPEGFELGRQSNTGLQLVENLVRWDLQGESLFTKRKGGSGARIEITFATDMPSDKGPGQIAYAE